MKTPQKNRQNTMRTSASFLSPCAVLLFLALVAAACGSNSAEFLADGPPPSLEVEYGASIDEWAAAAEESDSAEGTEDAENESNRPSTDPAYADIEWDDLVPEGFSSDEVWSKYLDEFDEVEFGSPEEQAIYDKVLAEIDPDVIDPALDGQKIRMNGFVAPLTYDEDIVTEFLLVPYFGACIHVPAPPSNQTVLVKVDKDNGLTTDEAWGAVWVEGTLAVESSNNDIGAASYAITGDKSGVYEDF